MGKILTTTYHDSVEKVTGFYNTLVNNSYYSHNDKKPTIVTYYNINKDLSSLDPGSKLHYANIGEDSPIRFNRIYDMVIYGFDKVQLQTSITEFGDEADDIEGEVIILPNSFLPTEGDYFEVDHIHDSTWLFIIKDVQKDTLDNGANVFKMSYKLDRITHDDISLNVVANYRCIDTREGTNIAQIVRCEDYDIAKLMDDKAVMLKQYYLDLFYSEKVQTFIFEDLTEYRVYDPYMIEFLIRNKILANGDDSYLHVTQQIKTTATFAIDYDKSFFRAFEKKDKNDLLISNRNATTHPITEFGTIFDSRYETYYEAEYMRNIPANMYCINCIPDELIYLITDGKIVEGKDELNDDTPELWLNILTKYFTGDLYTTDELDSVDQLRFDTSKIAFYTIPLLIFCLEKAIVNVLSK